MPLDSLAQNHLPSPNHASPTWIRGERTSIQRLFKLISVGKPCCPLEALRKLFIELEQFFLPLLIVEIRSGHLGVDRLIFVLPVQDWGGLALGVSVEFKERILFQVQVLFWDHVCFGLPNRISDPAWNLFAVGVLFLHQRGIFRGGHSVGRPGDIRKILERRDVAWGLLHCQEVVKVKNLVSAPLHLHCSIVVLVLSLLAWIYYFRDGVHLLLPWFMLGKSRVWNLRVLNHKFSVGVVRRY